jgi:plastocyanin
MRAATLALGIAVTLTVCAIGIAAGEGPKPQTHTVTMENMRFQPDSLTVARGDTIVWVNKDLVPHTATSKAGGFDSQAIAAGKSWIVTVGKKGDFAYVCTFHPTMTAMLRVE